MNLKEALLKNKKSALWIDSADFSHELILDTVAKYLNDGTKIIQFYFKNATDKQNIELGFKLRQLCSMFDALLIVNSRADIAQIIDADGLCLSDEDMSLDQAKKIFHNDIIFAKYIESLEDLIEANENKADYVCIDLNKSSPLKKNITSLNKIKIIEINRILL